MTAPEYTPITWKIIFYATASHDINLGIQIIFKPTESDLLLLFKFNRKNILIKYIVPIINNVN